MWTPDQFTKNVLREALRCVSAAETEVEVFPATQKIDVYASPDVMREGERAQMGLLGELAAEPTLFEAFWNTPGITAVRRCLAKQLAWHHELERRARAEVNGTSAQSKPHSPSLVVFPWLIILATGRPNTVLEAFACREVRPGIYEAATGFCLRIIVIRELPHTRETLLLRMFGRGRVFEDAVAELHRLPKDAWEARVLVPLLREFNHYGRDAKTNQEAHVTHAEQIRKLAESFQERFIKEGREDGQRALLLRLLEVRFGGLSPSIRRRVRRAEEGVLHQWAERILQATTLEQVFGAPRVSAARKPSPSRA